ncbi:uncharacterized protein J3D65DRAFT_666999 [Phyllosticta citribraziliensis]|uniref:Uncharacterized protein n=1 Tax=Phyllosticta citribraziliensis TaxID=989973 RepID=A0ABR1LUF7_9PEZI
MPNHDEEPERTPRQRFRIGRERVYREFGLHRKVGNDGNERQVVLSGQAVPNDAWEDTLGSPTHRASAAEKRARETKTNHIRALYYLAWHEVDLGGSDKAHREHVRTGNHWTTCVLEFISDKVRGIVNRSLSTEDNLLTVGMEARFGVLTAYFLRRPAHLVKKMFYFLTPTIDFDVVFSPPTTADDRTKQILKDWQWRLLYCWLSQADQYFMKTYRHMMRPEIRAQSFYIAQYRRELWLEVVFHDTQDPGEYPHLIPVTKKVISDFAVSHKRPLRPAKDVNERLQKPKVEDPDLSSGNDNHGSTDNDSRAKRPVEIISLISDDESDDDTDMPAPIAQVSLKWDNIFREDLDNEKMDALGACDHPKGRRNFGIPSAGMLRPVPFEHRVAGRQTDKACLAGILTDWHDGNMIRSCATYTRDFAVGS